MRSVVLLVFAFIFLLLPGLFMLTISGSTFSIALGAASVLCVLGSVYFASRPGRKNPLKFISFLFPIFAIILSKGYVVKYLHFTVGIAAADLGNLFDLLFIAQLGLIAMMSYETSNAIRKVATENGYDELELTAETGKLNNFSFGIGLLGLGGAFLIYLFITSVPTLQINPIFALLLFGLVYLGLSRFLARSRRRGSQA